MTRMKSVKKLGMLLICVAMLFSVLVISASAAAPAPPPYYYIDEDDDDEWVANSHGQGTVDDCIISGGVVTVTFQEDTFHGFTGEISSIIINGDEVYDYTVDDELVIDETSDGYVIFEEMTVAILWGMIHIPIENVAFVYSGTNTLVLE